MWALAQREYLGRDRFIYKIMSQDLGTAMTHCIEMFGVSILCHCSKAQEVSLQVSTSTHPGDLALLAMMVPSPANPHHVTAA